MLLDISTLKDETTVQYSRLKLLQLASQMVLPIRATSISLYLNWRRGYLETTAFSMLFDPPTPGSLNPPPPQILLRLRPGIACRILPWVLENFVGTSYTLCVLLHKPSITSRFHNCTDI